MSSYLPETVPSELRNSPQLQNLMSDVSLFCQLHLVQDKDSKRPVRFIPQPMQDRIFSAVGDGHCRIAVVKARQVTATTGCKMVLHHLAYSTPHAAMHAVVSMRADSASALLDDNRRWLLDLPDLLQRPVSAKNKTEITYSDTGASIKAFSSRSSTGLRSFSPAAALISEFAFAPDQEEVLAQADAAVGDGLLIIESTANSPGDAFSRIILGAPENGWHVLTLWWWEHPAYIDSSDMISDEFESTLTEKEKAMVRDLGLSLGQIHWRRRKVQIIGSEEKFRREYPASLDDCFLNRVGGFVDDQIMMGIVRLPFAALGPEYGREIEPPQPHDKYVMGVDIGGGVGQDYSVIQVVSAATMQPVYTLRSNSVLPGTWAHNIIQIATKYNDALVLVESNNHGHATLLELQNCGYRNLWVNPQTKKPWVTTAQSKADIQSTLREAMEVITVMDQVTWLEIRGLTIPPGKINAEAPPGSHDDCAMALALAYRALRDVPARWRSGAPVPVELRLRRMKSASRARKIRANVLPF